MTNYRPVRLPDAVSPSDAWRAYDDVRAAAGRSIVYGRMLPPAPVVQVPWSVRALRALASVCFAIAIIAAFAAGAILIARVIEGPGVGVALFVYAVAFGFACRKAKL